MFQDLLLDAFLILAHVVQRVPDYIQSGRDGFGITELVPQALTKASQ